MFMCQKYTRNMLLVYRRFSTVGSWLCKLPYSPGYYSYSSTACCFGLRLKAHPKAIPTIEFWLITVCNEPYCLMLTNLRMFFLASENIYFEGWSSFTEVLLGSVSINMLTDVTKLINELFPMVKHWSYT